LPKEHLDRAGRSQLHYAAANGNVREVARLIRAGADINLADNNGFTALHFATQQHMVEVAKLLVEAGAQMDAKDEHGNTPLSNAVFSYSGDGQLIQILRASGADPFAKNNYGVSPVELARNIANYDVAKFFDDLPK
jgi:ankyrin repeat protein